MNNAPTHTMKYTIVTKYIIPFWIINLYIINYGYSHKFNILGCILT
jgi:hypothetical protein